jgi:hypothetical protein
MKRQIALFAAALLAALTPIASDAAPKPPASSAETYLRNVLAPAAAEYGWRNEPMLTWIMGYDFHTSKWSLREYSNQMAHAGVGMAVSRLAGEEMAFCVAVGVELQQFFGHDNYDPRLNDRIRDISFYLVF